MKVLFNVIYYLFIVTIMVVALLLLSTMVPVPGNFKAKIVKSGSMEPYIRTGGMVLIKPSESYQVGDIITFGKDTKTQIPTTHRIVEINGEGSSRMFTTKGDSNDAADPTPTPLSLVQGKVLFSVPYLGFVLYFARKTLGFALLVGIPALIIIFDEIGKIIREIRLIRRKKIHAEQEQQSNTQ